MLGWIWMDGWWVGCGSTAMWNVEKGKVIMTAEGNCKVQGTVVGE
jgi:hypothetical protein